MNGEDLVEGAKPLHWFRVVRRVVTDETIYVQATSRSRASGAARVDYYGPYNPVHVKETIRSVSGPVPFDPKAFDV